MPEESPQQPDAKEELKKKLFEVREKRDLSAREVRDLADKNRANIDSFKKLLAAAAAHRKGRDEANAKVREAKAGRDELFLQLSELKKKAAGLQESISKLPACQPLADLKQQIEVLEWKLQTEATNARLENALSKQIRDLEKLVPAAEERERSAGELREARAKIRELIDRARPVSEHVRTLARESDVEHAAMLECFKKADALSLEISKAIAILEEARGKAAEESGEVLKIRADLSAEEKKERDEIEAEKRAEREKHKAKVSAAAQDAFERFKAGEKISAMDIMALQEAGLI